MTLSKEQEDLYISLMALTEGNNSSSDREERRPPFRYFDYMVDDVQYRVFNYIFIPRYTTFLKQNALESRGHTFELSSSKSPVRMACWPPEKFFNWNENESTRNLDLSKVCVIEDKADGSLISSYWHQTKDGDVVLRLKSRQSLHSDQAKAAMAWLSKQQELQAEVSTLTTQGYTVNMEWVSPDNRIVVPYAASALKVLSIRSTMDGTYLDKDDLDQSEYPTIVDAWTKRFSIENVASLMDSCKELESVEGFVLRLQSGQRIKVKTDWYRSMHKNAFGGRTPTALLALVLDGISDDAKATFATYNDMIRLGRLECMEEIVYKKRDQLEQSVEGFYGTNHELPRGDYAKLGRQVFWGRDKDIFSVVMQRYSNSLSEKDYLAFLGKKLSKAILDEYEKEITNVEGEN